jgi:hypothetical protein
LRWPSRRKCKCGCRWAAVTQSLTGPGAVIYLHPLCFHLADTGAISRRTENGVGIALPFGAETSTPARSPASATPCGWDRATGFLQLLRYALRSRVAQPYPRPEVRQTQLYGMFPMILFASSIVKPRSVSLRTLPREPPLSRDVMTASSVPSTMLTAS